MHGFLLFPYSECVREKKKLLGRTWQRPGTQLDLLHADWPRKPERGKTEDQWEDGKSGIPDCQELGRRLRRVFRVATVDFLNKLAKE